MKTITAILVDDEATSLRSLTYELNTYCPNVEVVEAIQDPVRALERIQAHKPDVVFLDIEMPAMNGFELLESLPSIDFDVIFVTAYDEFAIRAFEFNAFDYLLKPVLKSKLIQAVQKISENKKHELARDHLDALLKNMRRDSNPSQIDAIAIPTHEGFEMIAVADIVYLLAEGNYTWLHLNGTKKHLVSKTLKEVEAIINRSFFYRAHKSYLVNLNYVSRYVRGRGGYLVLKDGTSIPVSRSQKNELMKIMNL